MSINNESRFANYSRNMIFALGSQILTVLLGFWSRRVFVMTLETEYLGISGLFSSILTVLSLTELGFGTAITYALYKPIKENDYEKIKSLMALYKKVYWTVGLVVFVFGVSLMPCLPYLIKEMPNIPEINLIYLLFIFQSASGYFFSYKINFLSATQRSYQSDFFNILCNIAQTTLQIATLIIFKNYIVYLLLAIICPFTKNVFATLFVNKQYAFLKGKAKKLDLVEKRNITKNVFAMFLYKASSTLSATIDTVLVSTYMGIVEVGIYSNYHLIINYSDQLFTTVLGKITPSLGNFFVSNDNDKKVRLFSTMQLIYYWIATYLAVGLIVLFNPLIGLWLGKEYLFDSSIVIALVVSITLTNFQRPCALMRDANGIFWQGKLRPLAMSIINIISSIIFVNAFGTIGVVLGTILAKTLTYVWYDPYIVYKHAISDSLKKYFTKYIFHWVLLAALSFVCYKIQSFVGLQGLGGLIFGFVQITIIVNCTFLCLFFKTEEFTYFKGLFKDLIFKKILKK